MSATNRQLYGKANKQVQRPTQHVRQLVGRHHRSVLCLWLIVALLVTSTPMAAQTLVAVATNASTSLRFWFHQSGWHDTLQQAVSGQDKPSRKAQEKQKDRDARITRLEIAPGDVSIQVDEHVAFAAVASDQEGNAIGGVKVTWSCLDEERQQATMISARGDFVATSPGKFRVVAVTAGGLRAQVKVTVREGAKRRRNDKPAGTREVSTRDEGKVSAVQPVKDMNEQVAAHASNTRKAKQAARAHASANKPPALASAATPAAAVPLPGDGWDGTNYWSADDPGNTIGNPPGSAQDGGAGSGNFQIMAPVLALSGRGTDIGLGLAYNSRVWNKAGSQITFDIDRDWPAPGWSLGFGKLVGLGVNNGSMIIEADGTRHGFTGTVTYGPNQNYTDFVGHTVDGTFIDYSHHTGLGGAMTYAQAKYPNGTVIEYGAQGTGAMYPTRITDANGNYLTITYVNNQGPNIQTVTDTLGRVINFYYDAYNLLTAITAPGLSSGTRTLVRLHYRQLSLSYSFSGLTPVVRNSTPWVIDAIYYPGTGTGYWFGDTDSYSSYGMITKVIEQRGMGFSASSLNEQGTVSQGAMTRQEVYAYQFTNLTDAPTYTSLTETWTTDGVNTDQATTQYEVHQNATPRTSTVTLPNGNKSIQYSYNAAGQFNDGLVYYDETRDSNNVLLQTSTATWEAGAYGSPRPTRIESTDERGQVTARAFSYGSVYNQVTEARSYGYGGQALLRATRTQYQNSSNYTNRHIFNLPTVIEVYASDNLTRVSRTEYQYDGQALTDTPNVVMHDDAFNPYASQEYIESYCCDYDYYNNWCNQTCGGYFVSAYDPATDFRGNVTQVTTYANAGTEPASGAITETRSYDITGNMVMASTSCCQQTSISYTLATQYAYPISKTRGSSDPNSPVHVTNSATYDFNTGLELSATDANGRTAQTTYFSDTLRLQTAYSPTGAYVSYAYDETGLSTTKTTYLAGGVIADQNVKYLNGHGQVRRDKNLGANSVWDIVDTQYDTLGRVTQQSLPYRSGETIQWNTTTYDVLGRVISAQAPDGSTTQTFYNETSRPSVASNAPGQTMRVVDAWNRERWGRLDSDGRLVEMVEPNPVGNGTVTTGGYLTTYSYNTLGNLTNVTQDVQTRSFRYDSLGRLTHQKLAEADARLNDLGQYVGGSGTWSDVFTYDDRSNLTSRTDARGVRSVFNYNNDPLSRLQSVVFDTTGFGDTAYPVLAAPTITYAYVTTGDLMQLSSVTTAGVNTNSLTYDSEGRLATTTQTLASRPGYPLATEYLYDSLDRITDVRYPAEYGNGVAPRKVVHQDYDVASRQSGLKVDGADYASQITYNASSQTTSLKVGASGANQITENYSYHAPTGLLDNQTITRGASTLLNLTYDYAGANGKRTGQLTKITNNLDATHRKDRNYEYDAIGRLAKATGGLAASPIWTQDYAYDRFGNRLSVTSSGNTAKLEKPEEPKAQLPTDEVALKNDIANRDEVFTSHGKVSDASSSTRLLAAKREAETTIKATNSAPLLPQSSPPVFTDDPLVAGTTNIKAVHITELRDAVNQLRARAALSAATWTDTTIAGNLIKAVHIVELRTALDEARSALGLSNPAYTDPTLTAGSTTIKAAHVQELRDRVKTAWTTASQVPRDGLAALSYNPASNRITTAGYEYNAAGSLVRSQSSSGGWQRYEYDAAGRLVNVKTDAGAVIASYTYGASNQRLITTEGSLKTYYAWVGDTTLAEFSEGTSGVVFWSKSYVYLRSRLLATLQPNGSGGEVTQYHHPDNLGTRLITNASDTTVQEQVSLPFGTALNAESTGSTNRRFTSYDRSATTGLDYAVNRNYDSQQGRFTQIDPIGMSASSLDNPQSLNLYAYCGNDPINHTDANGLMWGWLKRLIRRVVRALIHAVIVAVITFITSGFNPYAALAAGVADFLKEVGWPTKGWIPGMGRTTPPFNPNAGSILSSGIGSLNRYIIYNLTQNPAQVGCTFNINIFGASGQLLADIQKELSRIFETGGHKVVFGQPNQANGGSMNLNVVSEYTGAAANTITSQINPQTGQPFSRNDRGILGVTPSGGNNAYVNDTFIWLFAGRGIGARRVSQGTMLGRVGAHEVIQHGFLQTPQEGVVVGYPDITYGRASRPAQLQAEYNRDFNINLSTAGALGKLCHP
jgi:RHS repeat-associated protein